MLVQQEGLQLKLKQKLSVFR